MIALANADLAILLIAWPFIAIAIGVLVGKAIAGKPLRSKQPTVDWNEFGRFIDSRDSQACASSWDSDLIKRAEAAHRGLEAAERARARRYGRNAA